MRRSAWVMALLAAAIMMLVAVPAFGQEEPTAEAEPNMDLEAGQEILVSTTGMPVPPTNDITISTCFVFPVAGPADCYLNDFGEYVIEVDETGAGEGVYVMPDLADRCTDPANPCQIVVSHGIGPSSVAAGTPIMYAASEEPTTTTTAAPETTTTTAAPETTTTAAPATTTTTVAEEDGGNLLPIILIGGVVVLAVVGVGLYLARRNS